MAEKKAPRTLRVTFEFVIPPGTPTNVRTAKRMAAVAAMQTAVTDIAARELPPETSVTTRHEWGYVWHDTKTDPVPLGPEVP